MRIENGVIVEATETELYDYYLKQNWYTVYDFQEYKRLCAKGGTKITDKKGGAK